MESHPRHPVDGVPRAIERDIDHIRHRIGSTVDQLEARLSPNQLIDQAIRSVREHGGEAAGNVGTLVKQNPLALLMVGAGVAWLMRGPQSAQAFEDRTRYASMPVRNPDAAREPASHARERASQILDEQPLMIGAIGLAIAAAIGAMAPTTRRNDRPREWVDELAGRETRDDAALPGARPVQPGNRSAGDPPTAAGGTHAGGTLGASETAGAAEGTGGKGSASDRAIRR